jgi:hypothetical protein
VVHVDRRTAVQGGKDPAYERLRRTCQRGKGVGDTCSACSSLKKNQCLFCLGTQNSICGCRLMNKELRDSTLFVKYSIYGTKTHFYTTHCKIIATSSALNICCTFLINFDHSSYLK